MKPNDIIKQQKESFEKLNTDDLQKTQILKILNSINVEIAEALQCESIEEFESTKQHLYNLLLYSTATVLTKTKSNSHRIAIFMKDGDTNQLKIHEGQGYSNEGKTHLRLDVNNSAAGKVFTSGEPYISGDITSEGNLFKRHPKSTKTYMSLMCVPIKCGNMVLGVLSIDGQEKDSFTKDDLDHLKYFANAITSFMLIERTLIEEDDVNEQSTTEQQEHLA
ncbi:GAF domain protein [compost metagenome]